MMDFIRHFCPFRDFDGDFRPISAHDLHRLIFKLTKGARRAGGLPKMNSDAKNHVTIPQNQTDAP